MYDFLDKRCVTGICNNVTIKLKGLAMTGMK